MATELQMTQPYIRLGLLRRSVARAILFAVCVAGALAIGSDVYCQGGGCGEQGDSIPDPQATFSAPNSTCRDMDGSNGGAGTTVSDVTVPEGGFVKLGNLLQIDLFVQITGWCNFCDPNGHLIGTYMRWLMGIDYYNYPPTQLPSHSFKFANYHTQTYDTTTGGVPYPIRYYPNETGQWQHTFQTKAYNTVCDSSRQSGVVTKTVNVMGCSPEWLVCCNPLRIQHLPAAPIYLHVPPDMWDRLGSFPTAPAFRAAAGWNAFLDAAGQGPHINIVADDCGSGPNCIHLKTGDPGTRCAMIERHFDPTTGQFDTASGIVLPTYWSSRTDDRLTRTLGHELGHLLGDNEYGGSDLPNYPGTCSSTASGSPANSIMAPAADCTSTTDLQLTPTNNDALPVLRGTYGSSSRRVCGF